MAALAPYVGLAGDLGGILLWVMAEPLVSIIIPSFNQAPFLRDALDSTLYQDYRPVEVLVCDGASTDGTVEILEEYGTRWPELRWWSEPDRGPADAVNKGLARATGPLAGIQSSDDIYLQGAIRTAVSKFKSSASVGLVFGDCAFVDEGAEEMIWVTSYEPFSIPRFLIGASWIMQASAFFRLDVARSVGGWRESCYVADLDLWLRMAFETEVIKVDTVMSAWREHGGQRNDNTALIWESFWRMIEETEGIRRGSIRLKLAARAGRRVFTQYYNPVGTYWFLRGQLWRALLTYPPVLRVIEHKEELFPPLPRLLYALGRAGAINFPAPPFRRPAEDIIWWR